MSEDFLHGRQWIEFLLKLRAEEQGQATLPKEIDNCIILLDECISFFGCLQFSYFQEIRNQQDNEDIYERRAYALLSGAIAHYLFCLRQLSVKGLDVGARAICRITSEYIDTLALLLEKDLAQVFCESQEPEAANKFWHTHLSKGKLSDINDNFYRKLNLSSDQIKEDKKWHREETSVLSSTIHPSFMAAYIASSSGSWEQKNVLGAYLGGFDYSQFRTIRYILIKILVFIAGHPEFPFETPKGRLLEHGIMHDYVRNGLIVIPKVCSLLLADPRNPMFSRESGRLASVDGVS